MYERHHHRLLPWREFFRRATVHVLFAVSILAFAVGIGTAGYRVLGGLPWLDAFLNASMILSGMGPVDRMETSAAKLFAALYALFSGLVFLATAGVVIAPWIHRLYHWMHLKEPS